VADTPTRSQVLRRDFLIGSAAGLAAGIAGTKSAAALLATPAPPPAAYPDEITPSYAQSGEDVIVFMLFDHKKVERPTYLDVGAFTPCRLSNTYLFYTQGSRGVLVEPNVDLIPELKHKRPEDTTLNVGVGIDAQAAADYYRMTVPGWNTFDKEEAEGRVKGTDGKVKIEQVIKMPLVPINKVIGEHFGGKAPDFLSIDVEGLDLPILKTLDFGKYRPKIICTETLIPLTSTMKPDTTQFLATKGYVPRAVTFPNTIYVDQTWLG
jgi:FkbM family methyltransferase